MLPASKIFAVTEFQTTWCTSGCDYTAASTAITALALAGNIKAASNLAKTGNWTNKVGSSITDNAAVTWDAGARTGHLIHMTGTQYLISCTTTTDCTNLGAGDTVSDGTNTFDISGAPDSAIVRINCHENATFNDNFTVSMGAATNSDATNYMIVGVDSGFRHNGTSSTGCKVQSNAAAITVTLGSHSSTAEWLRIGLNLSNGTNASCASTSATFGNWNLGFRNVIVENCVNSGAGSFRGVTLGHSANTGNPVNYIQNSIVYGSESDGIQFSGSATGVDNSIWNNTSYGNGGWGITAGGGGIEVVKNNLACQNTSGDYQGTYDTFTSNGSCDTSGTSGLTSLTNSAEFVNTGSNDYHLKLSAVSIDKGTNLGSSNNINIDIDNTTRIGAWDIGADEAYDYKFIANGGIYNGGIYH
jgi:hypothetical protein